MRILTILGMLLASVGSAMSAGPVFPASTNGNNIFTGANTFTQPITGLTTSNLALAGGTLSAPVLTTSSSSNSPANLELATAGWVRDLLGSAGAVFYNSTNLAIGFTNADYSTGTNFIFITNIPPYSARTYVNPANGTYFSSVTTTQKFLSLNAGIEVSSYLSVDNGGSGTAGPLIKPEVYVSYNGTNWQGDWDGPAQNIPEGGTNMYSWVVGNPNYVSTNATGFYVQRRFKMVTQPTPSASEVTVHVGTNFPSHIHLAGSTVTSGNAFLAVDQTFTGVNTFSKPIFATDVTASGVITGNGSGLTNLSGETPSGQIVTNGNSTALALSNTVAIYVPSNTATLFGVYPQESQGGGVKKFEIITVVGDIPQQLVMSVQDKANEGNRLYFNNAGFANEFGLRTPVGVGLFSASTTVLGAPPTIKIGGAQDYTTVAAGNTVIASPSAGVCSITGGGASGLNLMIGGALILTNKPSAPTPAQIGANNGATWVSNTFLYYSYTADGTTSNAAVKIAP